MKCISTLIVLLAWLPVSYGQHLIFSLTEEWSDSSWQNYMNTAYAYNSGDGTEAVRTTQSFSAGEWMNNYRTISAYDNQGRLETETDVAWNGTGWININRRTYAYESTSDVILTITTANWVDNEYQDISRITKNYDQVSGLLQVDYMDSKDQTSGDWLQQSSYTYTYNSANEIQQATYSLWDNLLSWVPNRRFTKAYTSWGDLQINFEEEWMNNEWKNSGMQHFNYDTDESLLSLVVEDWNISMESWLNAYRLEFTYNTDGTLHEVLNLNWLASTSDWGNLFLTTNTYGVANVGIAENTLSVNIFPNPATDQLTIAFGQQTTATVMITDLTGKTLETATASGINHTISMASLPAGVYTVNILHDGQLETRRIVKS